MNFEPLDLKHKELYKKYTAKQYRNSEASFTNMYIWRKSIGAHVAVVSDMLVLKVFIGGKYRFVMPLGNRVNTAACVKELYNYCKSENIVLEIIGADSQFVNIIDEGTDYQFVSEDMRNARDYVYLSEKLSALSGKKLHSKKNHVNKFKSSYNYRFVEIAPEHYGQCVEKTRQWMDIKYDGQTDKYSTELDTVKTLFDNYEYFELFGGCIYVDDELVAYTVGEGLSDDTALIHVEKADTDYQGSFAIINNEFATFLKDRFVYLNREEDMGLEGLRKAKESYKPEFLTEKIRCTFEMNK